ncbi:MAG TPA: hypothetical protein VK955_06425 [Xanthobacteraceae bacterium]|nr:hypothetical protein [Xanthobacteraceae bacterium]
MTTRKARIYLVQMGNETKLVRANGVSRAIQTAAKGYMQARVAEADDLIRIANQAGAGLTVATPPEKGEWQPGSRGRPPKSAREGAPAAAEGEPEEAAA